MKTVKADLKIIFKVVHNVTDCVARLTDIVVEVEDTPNTAGSQHQLTGNAELKKSLEAAKAGLSKLSGATGGGGDGGDGNGAGAGAAPAKKKRARHDGSAVDPLATPPSTRSRGQKNK